MPSAEAAIYSLLTSGTPNPVAALIGTDCFPDQVPQNFASWPAVVYQRISTNRSEFRTIDRGKAEFARPRMQLSCYATSRSGAIQLAQAVYSLLEGYSGVANGLTVSWVSTEDERGTVEPEIGPGGAPIYGQQIDIFMAHPE